MSSCSVMPRPKGFPIRSLSPPVVAVLVVVAAVPAVARVLDAVQLLAAHPRAVDSRSCHDSPGSDASSTSVMFP
jgi:hypothetical protein